MLVKTFTKSLKKNDIQLKLEKKLFWQVEHTHEIVFLEKEWSKIFLHEVFYAFKCCHVRDNYFDIGKSLKLHNFFILFVQNGKLWILDHQMLVIIQTFVTSSFCNIIFQDFQALNWSSFMRITRPLVWPLQCRFQFYYHIDLKLGLCLDIGDMTSPSKFGDLSHVPQLTFFRPFCFFTDQLGAILQIFL